MCWRMCLRTEILRFRQSETRERALAGFDAGPGLNGLGPAAGQSYLVEQQQRVAVARALVLGGHRFAFV